MPLSISSTGFSRNLWCMTTIQRWSVSFPSVPQRVQADRDGGFAVSFCSQGSIDGFKVESTCHSFNHPWPQLHVGRPPRGGGGGISSPYWDMWAVKRKKKKKKGETDIKRWRRNTGTCSDKNESTEWVSLHAYGDSDQQLGPSSCAFRFLTNKFWFGWMYYWCVLMSVSPKVKHSESACRHNSWLPN